jgi:UDP-N-acetylglucosamine--N-acetylmuramyl-(pentapeptide) pyrophosphoryl-undecaprenol N-acetylglucosamine transferase
MIRTLKFRKRKMTMKIIISGGGTGGHIFPALSIAGEIRKREPDADILFAGAEGRMEMQRVPAAGYKIIGLPVEGFKRKLSPRNFIIVYKLVVSFFKAWKIIRNFQPDIVIGVGGYASGPVLAVASIKKIPFVIQEQNSYAGITNRMLAPKAKKIFVAYTGMEKFFPASAIVFSGNPVREELITKKPHINEAYEYFNIRPGRLVILILGGSLGARTINNSVLTHLEEIENNDVQVIWQTGSLYKESINEKIGNRVFRNLKYTDFISRMDLAYAVADVIISRAGAGTISELCCVGKPVILIPSPNVAEDHQTKNAMAMVQKDAALMIRDNESEATLIPEAMTLVKDEKLKKALSKYCAEMALPDATRTIADEIFKIIKAR